MDGNFVTASVASVTTAAAAAAGKMPPDFRVSITNAPGKDAYAIFVVHVACSCTRTPRTKDRRKPWWTS